MTISRPPVARDALGRRRFRDELGSAAGHSRTDWAAVLPVICRRVNAHDRDPNGGLPSQRPQLLGRYTA